MKGSCHCGKVAFTADIAPTDAITCNCSICRRKGSVLAAVPGDKFHLERGLSWSTIGDATTVYTFNTHKIEHHTCSTCGCTPFARGKGRDGSAMVMVNLRCAEDVDLSKLKITAFDGASM